MALTVQVSAGEFLDKMTILEIKSERMSDAKKLANVRRELGLLRRAWNDSPTRKTDVGTRIAALKRVNETLWDIEERIRRKEADQAFDGEFIELARSVYRANDERAAIKRELNELLGSELVEEKSYPDYTRPAG